jgi:sortase A
MGAHQHGRADTLGRERGVPGGSRSARPGPRRGRPALAAWRRRALALTAELLITGGALVVLYLVWYLVVDDAVLAHEQSEEADVLERGFDAASRVPAGRPTPVAGAQPRAGAAFAVLRIPRFGSDWRRPVVQGTDLGDLSRGVGHYAGTALPGQLGDFAVAGHRLTHGSAFMLIDHLRPGDPIGVHTASAWYLYRVTGSEIVAPDRLDVIAPVPHRVGEAPTQRLMTLTSCNPLFGDSQRYVVHARLVAVRPDSAGAPAALTRAAA